MSYLWQITLSYSFQKLFGSQSVCQYLVTNQDLTPNFLKKVANLRINSDVPRWAYIQGLLSRGDRKVADILSLAHANGGNWPQTLKTVAVNPDFYVYRERRTDERFPWDFIDHGIKKSFLQREYQRAMQGLTTADCQKETCHICGVCKEDKLAF